MPSKLILCASQKIDANPYKFKMTGVSVYTFEEALYHCFYFWKQSLDDIVSDEFYTWVSEELELSFIASRIREISSISGTTKRFSAFLSITDYFDRDQIDSLQDQISDWEQRLEWEKLKERGDYLMRRNEPEAAFGFYKKALQLGEDAGLYNNSAIALMRLEYFSEAIMYLRKAHELDSSNINIVKTLAEAHIYNLEFDEAVKVLAIAEKADKGDACIPYLKGEIFFESGNFDAAINCFNIAIRKEANDHYIQRLADAYVKQRHYDSALAALERSNSKDRSYLCKLAEIQYLSNNVPAAIKTIKLALASNRDDVGLWILLAYYHRLDYDLLNAGNAIIKAVSLAPDNPRAMLENARIKKAQGKIRDYQVILKDILTNFKKSYRDE